MFVPKVLESHINPRLKKRADKLLHRLRQQPKDDKGCLISKSDETDVLLMSLELRTDVKR